MKKLLIKQLLKYGSVAITKWDIYLSVNIKLKEIITLQDLQDIAEIIDNITGIIYPKIQYTGVKDLELRYIVKKKSL